MRGEWKSTVVSSLAELNPETVSRKAPPDEITYVDVSSVSSSGIDFDALKTLRYADAPSRAQRIIRTDDILISTVRPYLRARARVPHELDGCVASTGLCVLRARPETDPGFLDAITRTDEFYSHLEARQTGTAYPAVRPGDIGDASVVLPPIIDQRRIADLIAFLDSSRQRLDEELIAARQLREPVRSRMLGLGGVQGRLSDIAVPGGIQIGPFGSQLHAADYKETGTPVVMPKDMVGGRISTATIARIGPDDTDRLSRHQLLEGDILLPRRGDLTKRALVGDAEVGWICGTGSIRVRVPIEQSRLVFEAISTEEASRWLISHAVGTTMLNLNTEIVGGLPVTTLDPEAAYPFVRVLEELERLEIAADSRLAALDTLRRSILAALVSGRHSVPASYDRLLAENGAGVDLEPIKV